MRHIALGTLVLITQLACDRAVTDFVKGARPTKEPTPIAYDLKISPGHVQAASASGADGSWGVHVTPTNRLFQVGGDMSAKLSFSQHQTGLSR